MKKNIATMSDNEFEKFLIECAQKGLTEDQVSAKIDADIESACPVIQK